MKDQLGGRRPLRSRETAWARSLARIVASWGLTPNLISVGSIGFAALTAAAFWIFRDCDRTSERVVLLIIAAVTIQLRLLCNLIDGLVAVEGGMKTPTGDIYNDLPDRISDALVLISAGYVIPAWYGAALGWGAALLAIFSAYVRLLGASVGTAQYFAGPMAKPHRMAVMTGCCLLAIAELFMGWHGWIFTAALLLIVVGAVVTIIRRTRMIANELQSRSGPSA